MHLTGFMLILINYRNRFYKKKKKLNSKARERNKEVTFIKGDKMQGRFSLIGLIGFYASFIIIL